jgi:hypothetical protein
LTGCLEASRAAKGVADEDFRRHEMGFPDMSAAVTRSVTLLEKVVSEKSPSTVTQAGEVEPEHGDALFASQGTADGSHRLGVFAAGKAVGKDRIGVRY